MKFNKIDMSTWNRKETYLHYMNNLPCTYSITINLDITKLMSKIKEREIKFFPSILYCVSNIVNKHKEFRMDLNEQGELGYYEVSNPCFTVFRKETETFINVWTEYSESFTDFLQNYTTDMNAYQNETFKSKPLKENNNFNISVIPWTSFTGFNLNLAKGYNYFSPIFTIGKYFCSDDKTLLPMAIQVNHAVCDGFHLSRFIVDLETYIDCF